VQAGSAIYVASPEGDTGKSTIALGLLHRLAATVARVGVFRPITRLGEDRDYILELLLPQTTAGLTYEQCVGVGYQQIHEDPDGAIADIVARYHDVAQQCDAVVIVGSDYTDVATPSELTMNGRIAVNLGAPVLRAAHPRTWRSSSRCAWRSCPASMPTPPRWWPTVASRHRWMRWRPR
jgi:phosphate acetyltransferase